ncbi:glycosyltransferase [Ornithinibacillus bavariensis]|uniref:Glycosyl transferase family 1 domain-containing protein n=1 Tax=Ornithinibacillus bavariensis TaxID=545502 RepID=A0A920C7Q7_9BACI|nr:glycosyltransferase [Ornithinibacillus bavariensis]GIO26922.1 hypothetical protein J43TS3_15330 [Ornithinibacillus bavariensis]
MKKKVVFAGHDLKFATGLINDLKLKPDIEVKIDKWDSHDAHDEEFSEKCLEWADVIFCEWGLGNAVWYSKYKKSNQKLLVRMHRQELETFYPNKFVLENINKIIAISPYIFEEFYRKFKFPRKKMQMIFNYVDMSKYTLTKLEGSQYNIGMIGISPKLKRIDIALDIFERLWEKDNRYKLYAKGRMPSEYNWIWNNDEQRQYYEEQFSRIEKSNWGKNVIFSGFGSDVNEWLENIGFILSTSDYESFHLAVAEGMASGAYPIIRNWDGVRTIYKKDWIFNSIDDAVDKIVKYNENEVMQKIDQSRSLNEFVSNNFSLTKATNEIYKIIMS